MDIGALGNGRGKGKRQRGAETRTRERTHRMSGIVESAVKKERERTRTSRISTIATRQSQQTTSHMLKEAT